VEHATGFEFLSTIVESASVRQGSAPVASLWLRLLFFPPEAFLASNPPISMSVPVNVSPAAVGWCSGQPRDLEYFRPV
jgi:hypothetical protein